MQAKPNFCCPLCGAANECAAALSGSCDTPCWCGSVVIPATLISRVPAAEQREACICRRCVEACDGDRDD